MIEPFYDEYDTAPVYVLDVPDPPQTYWRRITIGLLVLIAMVLA